MNLLLLEAADLIGEDKARVSDRRFVHLRKIVKAVVGDPLRVGMIGGRVGQGEVTALDGQGIELRFELDAEPPPPAPVELAVALPRPPTLEKVLQQGTAMGVKRFHFFHSRRVEKSYWTASALEPTSVHRHLLLGLEQARDTVLPELTFHRKFRPFAEDVLPAVAAERGLELRYAHPRRGEPCPHAIDTPQLVVLGPEGGFVDFELERLDEVGARAIHLGPRILRVETAVVALLGRLLP